MKRQLGFWDNFYLFLVSPMPWGVWCAQLALLAIAAGSGFLVGYAISTWRG